MKEIQLQQGKIYFISFGSQTQLVVRFHSEDACNYKFFDSIHYWNSFETFYPLGSQACYCVKNGVEEIREATLPEKHALLKFEIDNNCI